MESQKVIEFKDGDKTFRIQPTKLLGKGTFGVVYLGEDLDDSTKLYAVKLL
jgi:serine/threonine protein kinase